MSLAAMTWAMRQAPIKKTKTAVRNRMVLTYLADRFNDDSRVCWPSLDLIAKELDTSKTTIQRSVKELEEQGLIRRANPSIIAHIPEHQRPTVWTLSLHMRREDMGSNVDTGGSKAGDPGVPTSERGGSYVDQGGVPTLTRGCSNVDHLTQREPKQEPKENPNTPLTPQGGNTGGELDIIEAIPVPAHMEPKKNTRGERLPEEWFPTQRSIELVRNEHPTITDDFLRREHNKFTDHFIASSGANASKRDWDAAWRNWMRTAMERTQPRGSNSGKPTMQEINTWTLPIQDPNNLTQEPDSDYRPF